MKNYFNLRRFVPVGLVQTLSRRQAEARLFAVALLAFAFIGVAPHFVSQAQKSNVPNRVWDVSSQPAGTGTMVSIAADSPVDKPQNWQDSEGYHLVLPNTVSADSLKAIRGVKVRRVGTSLEVLFQTKPGSKVNVQAEGNEITLVVDKKLEPRQADDFKREARSANEQPHVDDPTQSAPAYRDVPPLKFSSPVDDLSSSSRPTSGETAHTSNTWSPPMGPTSEAPATQPQAAAPAVSEAPVNIEVEDEGLLASIFSATSVFVVLTLGLFGLLVTRKLRSRQQVVHDEPLSEEAEWVEDEIAQGTSLQLRSTRSGDAGSALAKSPAAAAAGSSRQAVARIPVTGPTSLYGAYRIDQEVGKLILGQPHRMDVLASRAIDDRRAIETSLIKGVNALDLEESARRRAREALEEYGFVARQCATLLLAPDAFERTSAARALGEIKSEAALPFLLESLYDAESIVRNQAVVSIGELKLPSAIGALLDIARTHPDVPSALLSRTLSACSVEGLDFFDAMPIEPAQLGMGHDLSVIEQITHLEPLSSVEELPEDSDNEDLNAALVSIASSDVQERAEALKTLAQFSVQRSVAAITQVARQDPEANLRALAIASLGAMDHESVFPAILIGMTDDTREVRASAARALNRLSFDRADAYVRVIETGDEETISDVARACIQAGIVSQNLDRLDSSDHRQAYETFSLICLLAKAKMCDPILDAIASHQNAAVRLKVVHLLACTGQAETFEQLRQLAVREGVSEEVKTALLEAMYKLDQEAKLEEKETVEASEADLEPQFETMSFETVSPETADTSDIIDSQDGAGYAFEFDPAQLETQPAAKLEEQAQTEDLEL